MAWARSPRCTWRCGSPGSGSPSTPIASTPTTSSSGSPSSPPRSPSQAARPAHRPRRRRSPSPFAACFLIGRIILLLLLARAWRHVPDARPTITVYLASTAISAALWAVSMATGARCACCSGSRRLSADAAGPILATRRQDGAPLHIEHLPERFGLLVILVLGEAVGGAATGVHDARWTAPSVAVGIAGFVIAAALWWNYFDVTADHSEQELHDAEDTRTRSRQPQGRRSGRPWCAHRRTARPVRVRAPAAHRGHRHRRGRGRGPRVAPRRAVALRRRLDPGVRAGALPRRYRIDPRRNPPRVASDLAVAHSWRYRSSWWRRSPATRSRCCWSAGWPQSPPSSPPSAPPADGADDEAPHPRECRGRRAAQLPALASEFRLDLSRMVGVRPHPVPGRGGVETR